MDFTKFINSRDIRDYHRKIKYKYNSLEAAWLVWQCCNISLKEKHDVWRWIINNMPDQSVKGDVVFDHSHNKLSIVKVEPAEKSLHETLDAYISMENRFIEEFEKDGDDKLFAYEYIAKDYDGNYSSEYYRAAFTDWNSCINAVKDHAKDYEIKLARVYRITPGENKEYDHNGNGYVEMSPDGVIQNVNVILKKEPESFIDLECFFDEQWFEFPVPFKEGDIVFCNNWYNREPVVLTDIILPSWQDADEYRNNKERIGDTSDMNFWGYYMYDTEGEDNHGKLSRKIGVDHDVWWNYMDVEYYRDKLEGINRCLKPISSFIKKEISIDLLLDAYHRIMTEEYCRYTMPNQYTHEGMVDSGLLAKSE